MASSSSGRGGVGGGLLSPAAAAAVVIAVAVLLSAAQAREEPCYPRLFSFGDSLTDTGNFPFIFGNDSREPALRPPYGETFFHRATGRFSDGRLVVDFIADALGLPFVRPYWSGRTAGDFACGANFAVGGATALRPDFFRARGVPMADIVHLDMEMKWFRDLLDLLCPGDLAGCTGMVNQSLFLVGEIGGNDYNLPLLSGVSITKIRSFTPSVIAKISSTITELIGLGAKTLVVPGNLPIGCVPNYLMIFKSDKKEDYEPETGCLRWMNEFSQYHNKLLIDELEKLRKLHPDVAIIYADYYGAAMEIFLSPEQFGIEDPLAACCGGGGPYGVSGTVICGYGEYKVCDDPQKYGSWDGFHPSEAAYKAIAIGLLRGSYTQPSIATTTNSCPQITELSSSVEYKNCRTVLHITAVAQVIELSLQELVGLGAKMLVFPGNLPIGCVPSYLMEFESDKKEDDEPETGCLRWMNEFSQYHNKLLIDELENLRKLHPDVSIIYADYCGDAIEIFLYPEQFGIEYPSVACCGGGGPYGVSASVGCGYDEYKVCDNPEKYGSWDDFHPSEAAYKAIAIGLLRGSYTTSNCYHH